MLDLAIGVANSVGRSLLVYVEPPQGTHPAWLVELADSLWLRSIGLVVGAELERDVTLRDRGASAVLYEAPDAPISALPTMALETKSLDELVATDRVPTPFWEKVSRAAHFALPVAAAVPTVWIPFVGESPVGKRVLDAPADESTIAAEALLRVVCEGALRDHAAIDRLALAIDAGMIPIERAVQAIVATDTSRAEQEDALVIVWPPLRALRAMP